MIGRTLFHRVYGEGTVVGTAHGGFSLRVRFEGFIRWVPKREVEWLDEEAVRTPTPGPRATERTGVRYDAVGAEPRRVEAEPSTGRAVLDAFRSRRIVEALRLGVTPVDEVPRLTFGREAETRKIQWWLKESTAGSLLAAGDYGSGKTHLLRWTYAYGLEHGWAVAYVDVDPSEAPFHKPKRLYRFITASLRYRDPETGAMGRFRSLLKKSLGRSAMKDHRYFRSVDADSPEAIWLWIEGFESIRPYEFDSYAEGYVFNRFRSLSPMYDYTTTANIYCHLLSGLSWASRSIGLKGLIIAFDEAESVDAFNYGYQRDRGLNFLAALQLTAANSRRLQGRPIFSRLDYCRKPGVNEIPFVYRAPTGLKLFFALTPPSLEDLEKRLEDFSHLDRVWVRPLGRGVFEPLFQVVTDIYAKAYDWSPDGGIQGAVTKALLTLGDGDVPTRMLVKAQVEVLDLVRLGRLGKVR